MVRRARAESCTESERFSRVLTADEQLEQLSNQEQQTCEVGYDFMTSHMHGKTVQTEWRGFNGTRLNGNDSVLAHLEMYRYYVIFSYQVP